MDLAAVPILFELDSPATFANHLVVQFDGHEFHLTFCEIKPPLVLGTEAEKIATLKKNGWRKG